MQLKNNFFSFISSHRERTKRNYQEITRENKQVALLVQVQLY